MLKHVGRRMRLMAYGALRLISPSFRAQADLFDRDFQGKVDWKSGLGDGGHLLYAMARSLKPEVVVEIGSSRGFSSCSLARACKDNQKGKVYAIDPHIKNAWSDHGTSGHNEDFLRDRLKSYGLDGWCEIIRATSAEAAKGWDTPIDLMFVDGNHSYEGVKADFEMFRPWYTENALVIFHDSATDLAAWEKVREIHQMPEELGVPIFLHELKQAGYPSITFPATPGLTVLDPHVGGYEFMKGKGWAEARAKA